MPADEGAAAGAGGGVACLAAGRARLRTLHDAIDPAHSAQDAFARAVLGGMMMLSIGDQDLQRRAEVALEAEWQAARRRWPRDLDIAWQAANQCQARFGCDEGASLEHLLRLDPDNAAVWWLAMRKAWAAGDERAYDEALARAASTRGSDSRLGAVFLALQPLLERAPVREGCVRVDDAAEATTLFGHPPTAADWAEIEAWSYELASITIVSGTAFSGCRESEVGRLTQRRRANCIATLSIMARGDTMIEQGFALPLLIQLEGDTPQGIADRERYRRFLYLRFVEPPTLMAGEPASVLAAGEVEALRSTAVARHRWPPPNEWLPAAPRQRALVTTGTVPQ